MNSERDMRSCALSPSAWTGRGENRVTVVSTQDRSLLYHCLLIIVLFTVPATVNLVSSSLPKPLLMAPGLQALHC